ncbi:hypothetical protein K443DRAFT_389190 [Laccaria amethystina LaAM-08-1]|uniref:Uncharacterized protein n=1 Tax=Laccaria amethystina LaAM-08-1 TaxID=1095629 RepID=A0A0C9YNI8_9AGAR|nr:hypothetical protein K443DRAFT_389190 [Laccaria amethystina LaAM-08-1]
MVNIGSLYLALASHSHLCRSVYLHLIYTSPYVLFETFIYVFPLPVFFSSIFFEPPFSSSMPFPNALDNICIHFLCFRSTYILISPPRLAYATTRHINSYGCISPITHSTEIQNSK